MEILRDPGRQLFMPPPPDVIDGEEHYTVQAFLDSRLTGKGRGQHLEYLVRWEGYPPNFDEWITFCHALHSVFACFMSSIDVTCLYGVWCSLIG